MLCCWITPMFSGSIDGAEHRKGWPEVTRARQAAGPRRLPHSRPVAGRRVWAGRVRPTPPQASGDGKLAPADLVAASRWGATLLQTEPIPAALLLLLSLPSQLDSIKSSTLFPLHLHSSPAQPLTPQPPRTFSSPNRPLVARTPDPSSNSITMATAQHAFSVRAESKQDLALDPYTYQPGFGNAFASEAIPGTLPRGQNAPQKGKSRLLLSYHQAHPDMVTGRQ